MIKHDLTHFEFSYYTEEGVQVGRLRYRYIKDNVIDAYTTKVDEAFQGKGIAGELYSALIEFVQQNELKIKPGCSYIEVKMQRSHKALIA
ncbi:GNAT family N-acetyltransferase [Actinobacillus vicugnae]|uniref:GNAT family N-acetyltransferase n=1 Tax=Actinobacillus vicugnae TaxID=2573093 RepID=UPI001241A2D7|nr:GNAT family N-acetyltransferase [Actinobacillus vicugnae]